MKWVHMQATELRIELRGVVFNFLKDAGSPEADLWPIHLFCIFLGVWNCKSGGVFTSFFLQKF